MNEPWIFLHGNLSVGFHAHGPFPDADSCALACDAMEGWMMLVVPLDETTAVGDVTDKTIATLEKVLG